MKKLLSLCFLFLFGCASYPEVKPQEVVSLVKKNNAEKALALAKNLGFYQNSQDRLLRYGNLGILYYLNGNYYQALQMFDAADQAAAELYTFSITDALLKGSAYTGETYEISLIKFYQSLAHFMLYKTGKYEVFNDDGTATITKTLSAEERKRHFDGARSILIDWNSIQEENITKYDAAKVFTEDMLAKTWGGYVHGLHAGVSDIQTMRILYKSVDRMLQENYAHYPSFRTPYKKDLLEYVRFKSQNERPQGVEIMLKTDIVEQKQAHEVTFRINMPLALAAVNGDAAFLLLAIQDGTSKFEVLKVNKPKVPSSKTVQLTNAKGKTWTKKMSLVHPISEIVYSKFGGNLEERIAQKKTDIQANCLITLATAHKTYLKAIEKKAEIDNDETLSETEKFIKSTVQSGLIAGSVALANSVCTDGGTVDLRQLELMPANIFEQSLNVPPGKYMLKILSDDKKIYSANISVKKDESVFLDINLPNQK